MSASNIKNCCLCEAKSDYCLKITDEIFGFSLISLIESIIYQQIQSNENRVVCRLCATRLWDVGDIKNKCIKAFANEGFSKANLSHSIPPAKRPRETIPSYFSKLKNAKVQHKNEETTMLESDDGPKLTAAEKRKKRMTTDTSLNLTSTLTLGTSNLTNGSPFLVDCDGDSGSNASSVENSSPKKKRLLSEKSFMYTLTQSKIEKTSTPGDSSIRKTIYSCDICDYEIKTAIGLKRHLIEVHKIEKPRVFKCDLCEKSYATSLGLRNHLITHNKPNEDPNENETHKEITTELQKGNNSIAGAIQQVSNRSKEAKYVFKCQHCKYETDTPDAYRAHLQGEHSKDKKNIYKCDCCAKSYILLRRLRMHQHEKHDRPHHRELEENDSDKPVSTKTKNGRADNKLTKTKVGYSIEEPIDVSHDEEENLQQSQKHDCPPHYKELEENDSDKPVLTKKKHGKAAKLTKGKFGHSIEDLPIEINYDDEEENPQQNQEELTPMEETSKSESHEDCHICGKNVKVQKMAKHMRKAHGEE